MTEVTILLVDDFATQRAITKHSISSMNFAAQILEAENGDEALEVLRNSKVDLIITDYEMPQMNGLELITAMKKNGSFNKIPSVMITSVQETKSKAFEAGASGWIHKPYDKLELQKNILELLPQINTGNTSKVLLIDDVEMQLNIWGKLFQMPGVEYHTAKSALEAWDKIKKTKYDLIMTDYMMPDVDGLKLVKKLKSTPKFQNIPIVVITEDTSMTMDTVPPGTEKVFHKPFNSAEVKKCIKSILKL